jgi:DNA-binding MarR family transcriptional regulator/GNAT superfamily N-acetyltransferase
MDALRGLGEIGIGSRLKRVSDYMMKETQVVYDYFNVDFDPYLFPVFKIIVHKQVVTNSEIFDKLNLSQPAITQAINKLIKKKLVEINSDNSDKRKKNIALSSKGTQLLTTIKPIWSSIDTVIKLYTSHKSQSLIENLNILEDKFSKKNFSEAIIELALENTKNSINIITYQPRYAQNFYDLNIEWLRTYFYVEPYDEEVLSKPDKYIINKGGHIFFAAENKTILGTVALMPTSHKNEFELTKMAVLPNHRGKKIGQKLMQYCIDFSLQNGVTQLLLYSNTKLENAIYIYRKYGFIEVPVEKNSPYNRSDIKMELKLG